MSSAAPSTLEFLCCAGCCACQTPTHSRSASRRPCVTHRVRRLLRRDPVARAAARGRWACTASSVSCGISLRGGREHESALGSDASLKAVDVQLVTRLAEAPQLSSKLPVRLRTPGVRRGAVLAAVWPQCSTLVGPRNFVGKVRRVRPSVGVSAAPRSSDTPSEATRLVAVAGLVAQSPRQPAPNTEGHAAPSAQSSCARNISFCLVKMSPMQQCALCPDPPRTCLVIPKIDRIMPIPGRVSHGAPRTLHQSMYALIPH